MTEMPRTIQMEGKDIPVEGMSEAAKEHVASLVFVSERLHDLNNQLIVLAQHKNAQIAEMKAEILRGKTGFDLNDLFEDD